MGPALPRDWIRVDTSVVAHVASAVDACVSVQNFLVPPFSRRSNSIEMPWNWRCVYHKQKGGAVFCLANKAEHAVVGVVEINPFEAKVGVVVLPESRLALIQVIQVLYQFSQTVMERILKQMPVEALIMIPFRPLAEFPSHEEQLFAGMRIHPAIEHSEVRKFLPGVPRHLVDHRAFAINHFVMAQHEDEILMKGVDQRKGRISLMVSAMDGFVAHVVQEIVHPSHVPFQSET